MRKIWKGTSRRGETDSLELEWAEKRKYMLEKIEDELRSDEVKVEKEYDITMRMLKKYTGSSGCSYCKQW